LLEHFESEFPLFLPLIAIPGSQSGFFDDGEKPIIWSVVKNLFHHTLSDQVSIANHDDIRSIDVKGEDFAILGEESLNTLFKVVRNKPGISNERNAVWTWREIPPSLKFSDEIGYDGGKKNLQNNL
jgi:hypothetical protein